MVRELAKAGYETRALHPNHAGFWNRDHVYPLLGFETFLSREDLRVDPNHHPGDRELFQRSLALLSAPHARPAFQFLVTLDSHAPYRGGGRSDEWLAKPLADTEVALSLTSYLETIRVLDTKLAHYLRQLRELPNPPLVLLFGDHQPEILPVLAPDAGEKMFEIEGHWIGPENKKLAWGNERRGLYCLAPLLLEKGGVKLPPYYQYVREACSAKNQAALKEWHKNPGLPNQFASELRLLSFDRVFGRQFSGP